MATHSKIAHFETLSFTRTVNGKTVKRLRTYSLRFKKALLANNIELQQTLSREACATMHDLTLLVRKAEDNGLVSQGVMTNNTGWIVENVLITEQNSMMSLAKADRRHAQASRCSLRICLNKLAHSTTTTFRVDKRKAHYVVITGPDQKKSKGPWVCEFNVNTLAADCAKIIRQLP